MEANEAHELQEQHHHAAGDRSLQPVSFTMSILAVFVAIVSVLGHRTHTEAVLAQARASDQWSLYQAHKIRQYDTQLMSDMLATLPIRDEQSADSIRDGYKSHLQKWSQDLAETEKTAHELEGEVGRAEHRADRFDLGEALLEISLVITSITLLAKQRIYWYMGMVFGLAGLVTAGLAFLIR